LILIRIFSGSRPLKITHQNARIRQLSDGRFLPEIKEYGDWYNIGKDGSKWRSTTVYGLTTSLKEAECRLQLKGILKWDLISSTGELLNGYELKEVPNIEKDNKIESTQTHLRSPQDLKIYDN
jgi:hypothetical protein